MPVITDLQLTITPLTALLTNPILDANVVANESSVHGGARKQIVLDFYGGAGVYARDLATCFQWPTNSDTILYVWQPTLIEQPEDIYNRASDWMDGGYPGAKFIQGVIVEAATFGNAKTFSLQNADDGTIYPLNETPATFTNRSRKAFSCVTPFISHSARLVSSDGVEWQFWEGQLSFQPFPELTDLWQTEVTSLGLTGWGHIRELNIPYVSTAIATLTLTFDNGPAQSFTLPNTSGAQSKYKQTVGPNKFKMASFSISSLSGVRVFQEDLEVKIKSWGSGESYAVIKPFGGKSAAAAEV